MPQVLGKAHKYVINILHTKLNVFYTKEHSTLFIEHINNIAVLYHKFGLHLTSWL